MIRRSQCFNSASLKIFFKIGGQRGQLFWNFGRAKLRAGGKNLPHLLEIILIIRAQIDSPLGRERPIRNGWKSFIDQPVPSMFSFRPRIRKINVQHHRRVRRQQVFQKIAGFDPHSAQIGQARPPGFTIHFADPSQQPFHPYEIVLGMQPAVLHQKRTVPAA